jgi:glutathione peroxidase
MGELSARQKAMKTFYPLLVKITRLFGVHSKVIRNDGSLPPVQPIYHHTITLNNGRDFSLASAKGKKILLVNTASDCGYTAQYASLQQLHQSFKNLLIIGFPANDFKEQEKGSDESIAQFCQVNFGVEFPLAKKSVVVRSEAQNPIFKWLTSKELNGWNNQQPTWNFSKYLVNEEGMLTHYFDPSVSPTGPEVLEALR